MKEQYLLVIKDSFEISHFTETYEQMMEHIEHYTNSIFWNKMCVIQIISPKEGFDGSSSKNIPEILTYAIEIDRPIPRLNVL